MAIWLFGDSVLKGEALTREAQTWPAAAQILQQPADLLNLLVGRDEAARWAGNTRITEAPEKCVRDLEALLRHKAREGDALVFLDVGRHLHDPDAHEGRWRWIIETAVGEHPVVAVVCESFDNGEEWMVSPERHDPGWAEKIPGCMYDVPFGERSHNDALREAAKPAPDYTGEVRWVPLSERMSAFQKLCVRHGATAYHDPIHLNIWGQLRLCALILTAIPEEPAYGAEAVARRFRTHWRELGAPSREAAGAIIDAALEQPLTGEPRSQPMWAGL